MRKSAATLIVACCVAMTASQAQAVELLVIVVQELVVPDLQVAEDETGEVVDTATFGARELLSTPPQPYTYPALNLYNSIQAVSAAVRDRIRQADELALVAIQAARENPFYDPKFKNDLLADPEYMAQARQKLSEAQGMIPAVQGMCQYLRGFPGCQLDADDMFRHATAAAQQIGQSLDDLQ